MPAQAGIEGERGWIPAFAGVTDYSSLDITASLLFKADTTSTKIEVITFPNFRVLRDFRGEFALRTL